MGRYTGLIVNSIANRSENDRDLVTDTSGISTNVIIEYINEAQERLQSVIIRAFPHITAFDGNYVQTLVAGQKEYNISLGNALFGGTVRMVRYSYSGLEQDYVPVRAVDGRVASTYESACPIGYSLQGEQILLSPIPSGSGASLRTTFVKQVESLDIRRGRVSSVASSGGYYTSLVLADDTDLDSDALEENDTLSVVTSRGVNVYSNLTYSSYDPVTRTVTCETNDNATTLGTIAPDNVVCLGAFSTTHSQWARAAERYLKAYSLWKLFKTDSSSDSVEQNEELSAMEEEIVAAYGNFSVDLKEVIVTDPEWFD